MKNANRKPMVLCSFLAVCMLLFAVSALAGPAPHQRQGYVGDQGGFNGPGPDIVTVQQLENASDKTMVALKGNIVQYLGGKYYVFKDATGTINVTIGEKHFFGLQIAPADTVLIYGKVKRDWDKFEIKVSNLIKVQ